MSFIYELMIKKPGVLYEVFSLVIFYFNQMASIITGIAATSTTPTLNPLKLP